MDVLYPDGHAETEHVTHVPSEPLTPVEVAEYPEPHDLLYPNSAQDLDVQELLTHFCELPQSLLFKQQDESLAQVWLLA